MTLLHLSSPRTAAIAAVLSVIVLGLRVPDAFSNPQLFAEDGSLFWLQAYQDGPAAVFTTYAGYLHLAPRLIALIASWFDPGSAPVIFHTVVVLLTAWAAATVALTVPNPWMGLCFALALLTPPNPGSGEIFACVTNVQWIMAPVLALLLLLPPAATRLGRISNILFCLVASLTGPFSIFAVPLAIWRFRRRQDALVVVVILAAILQAAVLVRAPPMDVLARAVDAGHKSMTIVVRAFGGKIWALPFGLGLVAAAVYASADRELRVGLLVFAAILLSSVFLKFKAEYTGILDSVGNGPQYFYVPHVALIWCTISLMFSGRKAAIAAVICTTAIILLSPKYFRRPALPDYKWAQYAPKIGKEDVTIPINPTGWFVRVTARIP
jgi:hypothetical protein